MASHISSFIPSTGNPLLPINEADEGDISGKLYANDQTETLAIDQEMTDLIDSVEPNEPVDSPPVVENTMPIGSIQNLPSTS